MRGAQIRGLVALDELFCLAPIAGELSRLLFPLQHETSYGWPVAAHPYPHDRTLLHGTLYNDIKRIFSRMVRKSDI